jgi:hypothetical protein
MWYETVPSITSQIATPDPQMISIMVLALFSHRAFITDVILAIDADIDYLPLTLVCHSARYGKTDLV